MTNYSPSPKTKRSRWGTRCNYQPIYMKGKKEMMRTTYRKGKKEMMGTTYWEDEIGMINKQQDEITSWSDKIKKKNETNEISEVLRDITPLLNFIILDDLMSPPSLLRRWNVRLRDHIRVLPVELLNQLLHVRDILHWFPLNLLLSPICLPYLVL